MAEEPSSGISTTARMQREQHRAGRGMEQPKAALTRKSHRREGSTSKEGWTQGEAPEVCTCSVCTLRFPSHMQIPH